MPKPSHTFIYEFIKLRTNIIFQSKSENQLAILKIPVTLKNGNFTDSGSLSQQNYG